MGRRLQDWYENKRAEESERLQRYWAEKYKAEMDAREPWLGMPVVAHRRSDGKRLEGYKPMDDDGNWLPSVYPDE